MVATTKIRKWVMRRKADLERLEMKLSKTKGTSEAKDWVVVERIGELIEIRTIENIQEDMEG